MGEQHGRRVPNQCGQSEIRQSRHGSLQVPGVLRQNAVSSGLPNRYEKREREEWEG